MIAPLRVLAERERRWRPTIWSQGAELMAQGAPTPSICVLQRGLVKLAFTTPDGGERIKSFIADRRFFGPNIGEDEGRFTATALEPSSIVALPATWLAVRLAESEDLQKARAGFEASLRARKEASERSLLCDSAETRLITGTLSSANCISRCRFGRPTSRGSSA